jgi:hypothetical protein
MAAGWLTVIMTAMLRTSTSPRVLLVADQRPAGSDLGIAVRRFRIARVRLQGRPSAPGRQPAKR